MRNRYFEKQNRVQSEGTKTPRNPKIFIFPLVLALMAGFVGLPAAAGAKTVDEIALIVDRDIMTRGEMDESIANYFLSQRLTPAKPGTADYEEAKKQIVDGFIREVLLAEEADREKVEITDGEIDHEVDREIDSMKKSFPSEQDFMDGLKKENISLDDLKQDIHDKLLRRIKANRILTMKQHDLPPAAEVSEDEIKQYYAKHPGDYEQVKFSIILFRIAPGAKPADILQTENQAQARLKEIKAGADFAAYAKKYSEDTGSAANGGDVGTVYRSQMEPKLAKGVFAIPVRGVGLVKTNDGVYLVKVSYKGKADYDSVAPDIKDHLKKQKQDTVLNQWVDGLQKNAYIVEDGKVVSANKTENADAPTEASAAGSSSASAASAEGPEDKKSNIYPTLPDPGSWAFYFGADGFNYGTQDLGAYYPAGVKTNQTFPFGFGLDVGMDLALDQTFQVGVLLEALRKSGENITDLANRTEQWNTSVVAPSLSAKLLIPLDESTNFILSAAGGYYLLLGSSVTITGGGAAENANLSDGTFGGQAGGAIEFFLDQHKNTAVDFGVGYRVAKFTHLSSTTTVNGPVTFQSPLTNSDGSPASVDFSGIRVGLGVKFYLGKGGN